MPRNKFFAQPGLTGDTASNGLDSVFLSSLRETFHRHVKLTFIMNALKCEKLGKQEDDDSLS